MHPPYKRSYAIIGFNRSDDIALVAFNCEADATWASCYFRKFQSVSAKEAKKHSVNGEVRLWEGNCITFDELQNQPMVKVD